MVPHKEAYQFNVVAYFIFSRVLDPVALYPSTTMEVIVVLQDYIFATSIESALAILKDNEGKAKIMAGGTDLVLREQRVKDKSKFFVDLSRIPSLHGITEKDGWIEMGANVTHSQAAFSPLIKEKAQVLACACSKVGGRPIRNVGTLAGNIISAQPAGDAAVALCALDARCTLHSCNGRSWEASMEEMYAGVGKSSVDCGAEILSKIRFRACGPNCGTSYMRMEQRKALSLPMLCVATYVELEGGLIKEARIVMAPVGPGPQRAKEAEAFLKGKAPSKAIFQEAATLADKNANFRSSSVRGSKEFRHAVLPVFIVRGLEEAASRAQAR